LLICRREVACVEVSDNVQKGIDGIGGGRITYVKIENFNFEAPQYALIDHKKCIISQESPQIQNSWIKSIFFQGGLLDGKSVCFFPELNSLIGIRGSGKSLILEILRYALDIPLGSRTVGFNCENGLIFHMLRSGGKVIVELVNRQVIIYWIERIFGQNEDMYLGNIQLVAFSSHTMPFSGLGTGVKEQ
jgi:hypothetical protein